MLRVLPDLLVEHPSRGRLVETVVSDQKLAWAAVRLVWAGFALDEVDFKDRTTGGTHLMTRIRRLFQRCEMDQNEVNILRGILTAVQGRRRHAGEGQPR